MTRKFHALGRDWEVEAAGTSHGVGPPVPRLTHFSVVFRTIGGQPQREVRGSVSSPALVEVPLEEIEVALRVALGESSGEREA